MAEADSTQIRVCTKCGQAKPHSAYSKTAQTLLGLSPRCRSCAAEYAKQNKVRINEMTLARYHRLFGEPKRQARQAERQAKQAYTEKACAKCGQVKARDQFGKAPKRPAGMKPYCLACSNKINAARRAVAPEVQRQASKRWAAANKERRTATIKGWREKNKERMNSLARRWQKANPERVRQNQRKRMQIPEWRLKRAISTRIRMLLKDKAGRRTVDLIGYTTTELRRHLERQFVPGMSWDNYGDTWHVDHIVPVSSFTFNGIDDPEIQRAWSLSNLRPIWARDNRTKHDKRVYLI